MPQLSPMSWVMVIMVFMVFFTLFAVSTWWMIEGKYIVARGGKIKGGPGKSFIKWGFGKGLVK
uniref:ATP synthase F0 subunit 8 n=1 Tax=Elliptio icterina TaxID=504354 RepID=A0A0C4K0R7_ELLIC|nr:ATP synthase F0 subunit 8 [Anodonta lucida]AHJ59878.1 ATP synthase F0 subunit 8 [Anodonta lucida]